MALVIKNLFANAGDLRDVDSVPRSGRSLGGGHGYQLQYSCLQNPMDRGAWWITIHRVAKGQTQLKWFSTHAHTHARAHTHTHTHLINILCILSVGIICSSYLWYLVQGNLHIT